MIPELKKGQLSIFIVLSAILVVAMVFLIGFNTGTVPLFSDQKSSTQVKTYVESCLEVEAHAGQRAIGLSGGWLYTPAVITTDRNKPEEFNKNAQAFDLFGKVHMPYWHYYDDGSESFQLNIPEYNTDNAYSIKSQMKRYLTENIEFCLDNFAAFEGVFEIEYDRQNTVVDIELREGDDFLIIMTLPLLIHEPGTNASESMTSFDVRIEDKLWVPYNLAKDITVAEAQSSFIEHRMLSFISPYQSATTRDLLPPFYDFRMDYDFRPWSIPEVELLLKQIISSHISKVQFLNTDYSVLELDPRLHNNEFAQSLSSLYTTDYLSEHSETLEENPRLFERYEQYTVKPTYEIFYPSSISISPAMGDQVLLPRPQAVVDFIPFFFTEYVAVYEMTMPVVFEIRESRANDDNFVFNLALEANIDHNSPLKENYELTVNLDEYNLNDDNALICDPPQFISDEVILNITDPINYGLRTAEDPEVGVEDAFITFECKGLTTCFVSQTERNGRYEARDITELSFRLPINCDPGTLTVTKHGHKTLTFENLNPSFEGVINLGEVEMPSQKELNVNVNLVETSDSQYSQGRDLRDGEQAFVIFENLDEGTDVQVIEITENNQYDLSLKLMPANYSIQGFVIYNNEIIIPSEEVCYKKGLFSEECQTLPAITLESWVRGGIEIAEFEVDTKRLLNSEQITVNLVDTQLPYSYNSLQEISIEINELDTASSGKEPYFD